MTTQVLTSSNGTGVRFSVAGTTGVLVLATTNIVSTDTLAVELTGAGQSATVLGTIFGDTVGLKVGPTLSALQFNTMVGARGTVAGGLVGLALLGNDQNLVNYGEILGLASKGLQIQSTTGGIGYKVFNAGSISGPVGIFAIGGGGTIKNTGTITGTAAAMDLTDAADKVTNSGQISGDVHLGPGDDRLINLGTIDGLVGCANGSDFLLNRAFINGGILFSEGTDTLINRGTITGQINAIGTLRVDNRGGTLQGASAILAGSGGVTLLNKGGVVDGGVQLGSGINQVDNRNGTINGLIFTGDLADSIDNRGGTIAQGVQTGNGADVIENRGGTIVGTVNMGLGNDRFGAGTNTESVNGSDGIDTLDLTRLGAVTVALDGSLDNVGVAADSAYIDFENIAGSLTGANTLVGNELGNAITGGRSADSLAGAAGDDLLTGNGGRDTLNGGTGADTLVGGRGPDTFVFASTTDATVAEFDRITDFSAAENDRIDLSAIDANTATTGDQAFTFIGTAAFGNHAGELHLIAKTVSASVVNFLEGDVNGDGTADFSIMLQNNAVLVRSDIVL